LIRLRDRLRGETQAAILEAAEHVFGTEGMDRARMESIAARAGVAVGTLYNHFEDRDALLASLVAARRAALLARLDDALAEGKEMGFEGALSAFLRALFEHWAAHRAFLAVLFQGNRLDRTAPGRGAVLAEVNRRAEAVLERGREEGKLRRDEDGFQSALLVGMVWGTLVKEVIQDAGEVGVDRAERVLDVFLRGAGR